MSFPPDSHSTGGTNSSHEELVALAYALQSHIELCGEILAVVQQEHQQLKTNQVEDVTQLQEARQGMLERLTSVQAEIVHHKDSWMTLTEVQKQSMPEIGQRLQHCTDLIMKIVSLDRENEQLMLRNKLVPPSHLPPAERQNPNLVAKLYKDQP
jgi:flagellar biosynthesis/type III secretory pathway chaperone